MPDYKIICPYCFKKFSHDQVHFRMETQFDETELNDEGMTEEEVQKLPEGERKKHLQAQTQRRKPFLRKDDEKYTKWWEIYGSTSEKSLGLDKKWIGGVHQLPILSPSNMYDQASLKKQRDEKQGPNDYFIYDGDGFISGVEDIFSHRTMRRVCPYCHNPLPRHYGKNPVKFISIIGVTTAGKTVYISQLLKYIDKYASYLNQTAFFTSDHETDFIEDNPVELGKALPNPTQPKSFSQPMFYDFISRKGNQLSTNTIVIYDIAGENCTKAAAMQNFGEFINHSDGIMLLVDPDQLNWAGAGNENDNAPQAVVNTIYQATTSSVKQLSETPIAVCVSKSDVFEDMIPQVKQDIQCVRDSVMDTITPVFNATDYNSLQKELKQAMNLELDNALNSNYRYFNYFAFSAIGGPVRKEVQKDKDGNTIYTPDGKEKVLSYPMDPPVPKRIAEPLFWLFYRFGFIDSDMPIRLPFPRPLPDKITIPSKWPWGKPKVHELSEEEKKQYWSDLPDEEKAKYWFEISRSVK